MLSKNKIILPYELCTGCAACQNICPVKAINLPEDKYGYIHAVIDINKCIQCHKCEKICPVYIKNEKKEPLKVFAAVSKNTKVHQTSATTGMGFYLAKSILESNGVVYGCSEKNYFTIRHIRITKLEDLQLIQNSKYVQSNIGLIFKEIKKDLINGKIVLFTGTPCQVAGLKNFLGKTYYKLITIDLVCHGVPPIKMLKEQICSYKISKKYNLEKVYVDFRWKSIRNGSFNNHFGLRTAIRNGSVFTIIKEENEIINPYMRCFKTGVSLRDSCLKCNYATKGRVSDITIADFWGLGTNIPSKMNASSGVSLTLINTEKGLTCFNRIVNNFITEEHIFEDASEYNKCLIRPFQLLQDRNKFLKYYEKGGLIYAAKKLEYKHYLRNHKLIKYLLNNTYTFTMIKFLWTPIKKIKNKI